MKFKKRKALSAISLAIAATLTIPYAPLSSFNVSAVGEGLYINEICAKNSTHTAPDGQCYDWIEIYNSGSSAVDLSGLDYPTRKQNFSSSLSQQAHQSGQVNDLSFIAIP